MQSGKSFKMPYELSDYGKLLFEFDGNMDGLDMSKEKRKAMFRSPAFYYMLLLVFTLVVWFLGSLISNAMKYGIGKSLAMHGQGFFVLFVMCLIVCLSAFGGWNKFMRFASKGGNVKGYIANEKEKEEVDAIEKNAIQIYKDYLVITNFGWTQVYYLDMVAKAILESSDRWHLKYDVKFISVDGEEVTAVVEIPREQTLLIILKKIIGDKLKIRIVVQVR